MNRLADVIGRTVEAIAPKQRPDLPAPWSENALHRVRLALTQELGDALPQVLRTRLQDVRQAREVANIHYNLDPRMYELMLGESMAYTCAYHPDKTRPFDLNEAQRAKMNLVCRKLRLQPGMRVLDIGCGFGSLAKHMATNYGTEVVGVTISEAQHKYGQKKCDGLPIELRFQDYREINDGPFDAISSVGMFENVGPLNYREFFDKVKSLLKDDGLFLLHTIGCDVPKTRANILCDTFIFPGGVIPSRDQIAWGVNGNMQLGDLHEFGGDYALTLRAWHDNIFSRLSELAKIDSEKYGLKFQLIWDIYLQIARRCFEKPNDDPEQLKLWQFLYGKNTAVKSLPPVR